MKWTFFLPIFLLLFPIISKAQQSSLTLYYEIDKSNLTLNHTKLLDDFFKLTELEKIEQINITGHTDTTASKAYNLALSLKRASHVKDYFLTKGIAPSKINTTWFGESKASATNDLLIDRRVQIDLIYQLKDTTAIVSIPEEIEVDTSAGISELFAVLTLPVQEFCISPNKDTLLQCDNGTLINIKASSFKLSQQQRKNKSCITFQVKEVFLKSEMILENLSTTADGELLETQGMVYTNALLGKDTLELQKDIVIMMPADTIIENLAVLDGERAPHSDIMNWTVNNNSVLRDFTVVDLDNCLKYNKAWALCNNQYYKLSVDPINQKARCIRSLLRCGGVELCWRCKFFFCRIARIHKPFIGIFNRRVRRENRELRACQKYLRAEERFERNSWRLSLRDINWIRNNFIRKKALKGKVKMTEKEQEIFDLTKLITKSDSLIVNGLISKTFLTKCNQLDSLLEAYEVENVDDLIIALNRPLMEEFGVYTVDALLDTLPKSNFENLEVAYKNKSISFEDFKFYIFNSSNLGWKNLDIFADIPEEDLVDMKILVPPSRQVDCKLVFIDREFVVPAIVGDGYFYFKGMPRGEQAWLVSLKNTDGTPLLAMKSVTVQERDFELDFKTLSLEELREELKVLDFK